MLAPSLLQGPRVNPVPEDDIAEDKAAMPEGDPLALVHAPGLPAATDLAYLDVDVVAGEHTVANQGAEGAAFRALLLIVDHELVTGRGAIGVRSRQARNLPDQAR